MSLVIGISFLLILKTCRLDPYTPKVSAIRANYLNPVHFVFNFDGRVYRSNTDYRNLLLLEPFGGLRAY